MFDDKPYTFDRVVRMALTVAVLWGLVWLLGYLSDVLIPFAVAALLAYLINPLVCLVQKKLKKRLPAVILSLLLVVAVLGSLIWLVLPIVLNQMADMARLLKRLGDTDVVERAATHLPPDVWQAVKDLAAKPEVQELFQTESFWTVLKSVASKVLPGVWGVITGTASLLMGFVGLTIIVLYLIFLLLDYQKLRDGWRELIPAHYRKPVLEFISDFNNGMKRYFRGQAAVASIVGTLFACGFWLIGLPMGVLLGLFIGLLNMVPYLQILGFLPAVLLALMKAFETGGSVWGTVALVGLVFIVVQAIQDTVIVPRIMGKVTGLSPAMILLSLSIWGKLLGIFGLIIALPMTCLLMAYYRRFLTAHEKEAATEPKSKGSDKKKG